MQGASAEPPIVGLDAHSIRRSSTAEQVAKALRSMILSGGVAPGRPLREAQLAATVGVSRNTMREALHLLSREGLVTRHMHRGALVTTLTPDDVKDIFRVRRLLELAALEAAVEAGPDEIGPLTAAVDRLEAAVEARDWTATVDSDREFHVWLVGLLGSDRLSRFYDAIQAEVRLCLSIVDRTASDHSDLVSEHRELIDLIRSGDRELCAEVMAGHLADSERIIMDVVSEDAP